VILRVGYGTELGIPNHEGIVNLTKTPIEDEEGAGTTVHFTLASAGAPGDQLPLPMEPSAE
jgi:hypothetical protein